MRASGTSWFSQDLNTCTKIPVAQTPVPLGCGQRRSGSGGKLCMRQGLFRGSALSKKPVSTEGPSHSL